MVRRGGRCHDERVSGSARDLVRASRLLSWMLRHAPHEVGLRLDEAGWAGVEAVLAILRRRGVPLDRAGLAAVVAGTDKRRFALSPDGQRIRALQGHSVAVRLDHPQREPPPRLFHGTVARFVASILREGLRPGERHHVHLSPDLDTARTVGARRGAPVVLVVQARAMHAAGHRFWLSPNGVWLTERVPPRFLARAGP